MSARTRTRPLGKYDTPPPPWPLGSDPRTPDCVHDWSAQWGQAGERQILCGHCQRWIWERKWWSTPHPDHEEQAP